jgi:hypothetical protein
VIFADSIDEQPIICLLHGGCGLWRISVFADEEQSFTCRLIIYLWLSFAGDFYEEYLPHQKKFDILGMAQKNILQIPIGNRRADSGPDPQSRGCIREGRFTLCRFVVVRVRLQPGSPTDHRIGLQGLDLLCRHNGFSGGADKQNFSGGLAALPRCNTIFGLSLKRTGSQG